MKSVARNTLIDFFKDFEGLDKPFLIYDDGFRVTSYTYNQTVEHARALAAFLQSKGIAPGDKIIIYAENRPEWLFVLWGAILAGIVVVPIDYRSSLEFVDRIKTIVQARWIYEGGPLPDAPAATFTPVPATPDTVAEIIFTSGATAEPKGVVITHRNVLANIVPVEGEVHKYRKYGKPFSSIRFLNLLPLSHMFGQAMATHIPPMLPGVVVFIRGFNPAEIIHQIKSRRISVLVSVPKILEILREYVIRRFPELENLPKTKSHWLVRWWRYRKVHSLFGWKFWSFIVGAAPLPPDLESFWSYLGFVVIQGYGLTETAPIVTLNHPFHTRQGSVGSPIAGVEVKIAPDGEILVRGPNVTTGYYNAPTETERAFADGWFHTGDIGELDSEGRLTIQGRKKEMIVTPEGLNVFPDDVERVLNRIPGVRDSAVVGTDRVHAVLILDPGIDVDNVVRQANAQLADYQKIRTAAVWPHKEFPRTEGTGKLKRHEIAKGTPPPKHSAKLDLDTPLDQLTSLERVERMVALNIDESEISSPANAPVYNEPEEANFEFPRWNRSWWARAIRRLALPFFLIPLARAFAWLHRHGMENLEGVEAPVILASNHQSYMDVIVIFAALPARLRYKATPAMRKEFFDAHYHPERHGNFARFTSSLNYYLASLMFHAFPIPQREAGALDTLRYMGELSNAKECILIFPEGKMTDAGEIHDFQPGVGMIASKLQLAVVPIRLRGLEKVLNRKRRYAIPGRVDVTFGKPLHLTGNDYIANARQVEQAVRNL